MTLFWDGSEILYGSLGGEWIDLDPQPATVEELVFPMTPLAADTSYEFRTSRDPMYVDSIGGSFRTLDQFGAPLQSVTLTTDAPFVVEGWDFRASLDHTVDVAYRPSGSPTRTLSIAATATEPTATVTVVPETLEVRGGDSPTIIITSTFEGETRVYRLTVNIEHQAQFEFNSLEAAARGVPWRYCAINDNYLYLYSGISSGPNAQRLVAYDRHLKTRVRTADIAITDLTAGISGIWVDDSTAWVFTTNSRSQRIAVPYTISTGTIDTANTVVLESIGNPGGLTQSNNRWWHPISAPGVGTTITRLYTNDLSGGDGKFFDLPVHAGISVTPRGCGSVLNYVVISAYVLNFSTRVATFELFFFDTTTNLFETTRPWSLSPTNSSGVDVTGDDGVLWVYDEADNKVYAYNADTGVALT